MHFLSVKGVSKTHFKCERVSISDNPDQELHPFLYSFPMPIITQHNGIKAFLKSLLKSYKKLDFTKYFVVAQGIKN
jgi:hypothetical protein